MPGSDDVNNNYGLPRENNRDKDKNYKAMKIHKVGTRASMYSRLGVYQGSGRGVDYAVQQIVVESGSVLYSTGNFYLKASLPLLVELG